jgi:hypothetical protein
MSHELIGRRAELMAELLLQDLGASFVAKPSHDFGYDFLVGFPTPKGGINLAGVQVKATQNLVRERFPLPVKQYLLLIHSNIPTLLLVVDVKNDRFYYAWPEPQASKRVPQVTVNVPVWTGPQF